MTGEPQYNNWIVADIINRLNLPAIFEEVGSSTDVKYAAAWSGDSDANSGLLISTQNLYQEIIKREIDHNSKMQKFIFP